MRRFISYIVVGFVLTNMAWLGLFALHLDKPIEATRWFHEIDQKKRLAARNARSAKMLIVSGSSGLFGISAAGISQSFELPVVNLAIHADLGLAYILDHASKLARPGDSILLSLEYAHYAFDGEIKPAELRYITTRDTEYFHSLPIWDRYRIAMMTPALQIRNGILAGIRPQKPRKGYYDSSTVTAQGDETANRVESITTAMRQKLLSSPHDTLDNHNLNARAWSLLEAFIARCRLQNITVYAAFPGYLRHASYDDAQTTRYFDQIMEFYAGQEVTSLGHPRDSLYPINFFFDTRYHLNDQGVWRHTRKLIEHLKQTGFSTKSQN